MKRGHGCATLDDTRGAEQNAKSYSISHPTYTRDEDSHMLHVKRMNGESLSRRRDRCNKTT